jgi:ubiquinone/menaquinone biosynthesis C-methylase UbiE
MILLVLGAIAGLAFLVWWLIFETEGVYLGRGVVIWLYDVYARRYDGIKEFDDYADFMLISQPIMERIHPHDDPMMLDVATGTGRVPMIMARNPEFYGHVVGVDLSAKMLAVAQEKVADQHFEDFITLMVENGQALPFVDDAFDVVTCLEALEFMPSPDAVLREMCRVLRPGGILLTTIRIDTRWMPNRTWDEETMRDKLSACGMESIAFEIWQADYTKVWAVKAGESDFGGVCVVDDIMKVGVL